MRLKHIFFIVIFVNLICILWLAYSSHFLSYETLFEKSHDANNIHFAKKMEELERKIDPKVDPCDDFYHFVCGGYINATSPEEGYAMSGIFTIDETNKNTYYQLKKSLAKIIHVSDTGPVKMAKYLYQTCSNTAALDKQGLISLLNHLERIGGWPVLHENKIWNEGAFDWTKTIFKIGNKRHWFNPFLSAKVLGDYAPHSKIPDYNIYIDSPDDPIMPSMFFRKNYQSKYGNTYFKYMVDMAVYMGADLKYAIKELSKSLEFEINLAFITYHTRKNPFYSPTTIAELISAYPFFPWIEWLNYWLPENITLDDVNDKIIVVNPYYIVDINDLIQSTPMRTVANYVIWKKIYAHAEYLNTDVQYIRKNFANAIYDNSTTKRKSRSTQCIDILSEKLPLVTAAIYAREHYNKDAGKNVSLIEKAVHEQFVEMLKNSNWMDEETKKYAVDKAMAMSPIIGFRKELFDSSRLDKYYRDLEFINTSYYESILSIDLFLEKIDWMQLNPVAVKDNYWMNLGKRASSPGAYYDEVDNSLYIAAGIVQDNFYNYHYPMYMNYGGIGFVIAHEISHGFDSKRMEIDKQGNYINWWNNSTREKYMEKINCIYEQYKKYTRDSLHANMSFAENIADNVGMRVAYLAYKKLSMKEKNQELLGKIYTPQQMFWISIGSTWCSNSTYLEQHRFLLDTYCLPKYRIMGSLRNMKEFSEDFQCPVGSPMNPSVKKCTVW